MNATIRTIAQPPTRAELARTNGPHLIDGEFQSDKYPTTPRGKVPLSVKDTTAQDLLWEYAQRRRAVDAEFADDLEAALKLAGYVPALTRAEIAATIRARVSERIAPRSGWTDDTALVDGLGLDSLELWDLAMAIEDDFAAHDWSLDPAVNPEVFATVNTIAEFVAGRIAK